MSYRPKALRRRIAVIQSGEVDDLAAKILKVILLPIAVVYAAVVILRNMMYTLGLLKRRRLPGRTISVGNITTGGTGKTPVVLLLARSLRELGYSFAILTRGYGAAFAHSDISFNSSRVDPETVDWLGDEVAMLAAKLEDCWLGVGKQRYRLGLSLAQRQQIKLYLLDDGFQHRQLVRHLDLVVIDSTRPFGNGLHLPAGSLREGIKALRRADLVLLTRTEIPRPESLETLVERIGRYLPRENIFRLRTEITGLRDLVSGEITEPRQARPVNYWAFSAIGNPRSFEAGLGSLGLQLAGHSIFSDHHRYDDNDIYQLVDLARRAGCDALITTDKDAVKIPKGVFREGECLVLEISFAFVDREDIFHSKIIEVIGAQV